MRSVAAYFNYFYFAFMKAMEEDSPEMFIIGE